MAERENAVVSNIIDANNWRIYFIYCRLEGEDNALFTHINLHTLLSLLSQNGCYRNRWDNFGSILHNYNNKDLYVKCYGEFQTFLRLKANDGLLITNKLLVKDNYVLQNDFTDLLNNFNYEIGTADFSSKGCTAKILNSWFEDKTNGVIKNVISSDSLNDDARIALLNAIHFKGMWKIPFRLEVDPMTFHVNENESIQTQMIKIRGEVPYRAKDDSPVKTIELTFGSDDLSLIVVLPNKGFASGEVFLERHLTEEIKNMDREDVEVYLPKFKIEKLLNCRNMVSDEWLAEEFRDNINIFDMIDAEELLKYAEINEKSGFKLDEEGVEAASGLGITLVPAKIDEEATSRDGLKMSEINVKTTVSNRYAKTLVTCRLQNRNEFTKEATFTLVLPKTAFITELVLEMDGKSYKSYIKGNKEEKESYDEDKTLERTEGIFESDIRDSNKFVTSVNLEPQSIAVFLLTYEEILQRVDDQYELVLNIYPGQVVDTLNVEVSITESAPLKFVRTPPIRSGQATDPKLEKYLKTPSEIKMINANTSIIKFSADPIYQQKIGCYLGSPISQGFAGQFVVQYEVERDSKDGEILLKDGYFVHFFAPNAFNPLPKHVVFVLDIGPNNETNIAQLKDAMMRILSEIRTGDLISIIDFNYDITVWDIISEKRVMINFSDFTDFEEPFGMLSKLPLPSAAPADDVTISKAKRVVQNIFWETCNRARFAIGGLQTGLYIIKVSQEKYSEKGLKYQPIMIFLACSKPNIGIIPSREIVRLVTRLNLEQNKVPIFSLSIGEGPRKAFLRDLSLNNFGFSKQIYAAADTSTQLQSFYEQISSPLLSDVTFKYESDVTDVSRSHFPLYFGGGELVVSGRCRGLDPSSAINCFGINGYVNSGSIIKNPVTSLERMWAYLTVMQLLDQRNTADDKRELTKKAIDMALKYSLVTEVSPLVVAKPGEIYVDTEDIFDDPDVPDGIFMNKPVKKRIIKKSPNEKIIPEEPKGKLKPLKFIADHPFLVALMLRKGEKRIILFMGWVYKPSG